MKILILALTITSCAHENVTKPKPIDPDQRLADKLALYCDLAKEQVTAKRYAVSPGDAMIFTSLHTVACGYPGIDAFCTPGGRCYRDPDQTPVPIFDSTFSKDMALGMLAYSAFTGDNALINRWINYGDSNNWEVGDAVDGDAIGTVIMAPDIVTLAFDVRAYNDGDSDRSSRDSLDESTVGYKAHLSVVRRLVLGKINGGLSDDGIRTLTHHANRQPPNALFQAAIGLYDGNRRCVDLLLDETHWPADALPTSKNHYSDYLYQRDYDSGEPRADWDPKPGDDAIYYDGTDFVLAAHICLGG